MLAAVTVGIYMGRLTSTLTTPTTRIQGHAVWEIVSFLLNSALFVLVGLQLPTVIDGIGGLDTGELIRDGALIAATVIVVRLAWVFPLAYLPRLLLRRIARARAEPAVAADADHRLDRDAGRGLARGRARAAVQRPTPEARSPNAS